MTHSNLFAVDPEAEPGAGTVTGTGIETATATGPGAALSLRQKFNLIFAVVSMLVLGVLVTVDIQAARASVHEEIDASHRIAVQLLGRITRLYALGGLGHLASFLGDTGRVRANDITLQDDWGKVVYASPPSAYKPGRNAPRWYAALVTPALQPKTLPLAGGKMIVTADPSRAVLDAWDDLKRIVAGEAIVLAGAYLLIFMIVGRTLAPLERIQHALREIERGQHHVRLPPLPGKETGEMGRAFNRMAQAVEENIEVRHASAAAEARLAAQREFTALLHRRIEEERAALARELHDELGQSLTAIRSIAKSLMQDPDVKGRAAERSAQVLFDTAGATVDALHRMIPRLRPIQLEGMGLADAVRDLVCATGHSAPSLKIDLALAPLPALPETTEIAVYRIAQEAFTNVIRHAGASRAALWLRIEGDDLRLTISDDGRGVVGTPAAAGHFGVRGMQERAESLDGSVTFRAAALGGLEVDATIPIRRGQA
jgi:two-component system, NarL family, sensor histidine kinase UhpB